MAARLGQAHRATADVDTVVDDTTPPDAVEAVLALPGTEPDPDQKHRVWVAGTKIEFLPVGPVEPGQLDDVPERNALFAASHAWALDQATPLTVVAREDPTATATAPFATPGPLVAMKLHAIQDRSATRGMDKRGGDALDIYRLLLDRNADGEVTAELAAAPDPLPELVVGAARRILLDGARRTSGWMRATDRAVAVSAEELQALAEPVVAGLT